MTDYPFSYSFEVIFRDIDMLKHVNNAVYFTYMETARIKFYRAALGEAYLKRFGTVIAQATCTYKSPALLDETLFMGVGISRLGRSSFDMQYHITAEDGRTVAEGQTTSVHINLLTGQSQPIPEEIRAQITDFQQGWTPPSQT